MPHLEQVLFAVVCAVTVRADVLLDDFEDGNCANALGWPWFYFSDVNDGGNSKILNAEQKSDGSYEKFRPDTTGYRSTFCGKIWFDLGDTAPANDPDGNAYFNFAGIGTDMTAPGCTNDLHEADGMRFLVRGTEGVTICCELITNNIHDNGYYRRYFELSGAWDSCTAFFDEFRQPYDNCWPKEAPLDLTEIRKITWKLFADIEGRDVGYDGDGSRSQDSGFFAIDEVYLMGIDSLAGPRTHVAPALQALNHCPASELRRTVNLAGRTTVPQVNRLSAGVYLQNILIKRRRYGAVIKLSARTGK